MFRGSLKPQIYLLCVMKMYTPLGRGREGGKKGGRETGRGVMVREWSERATRRKGRREGRHHLPAGDEACQNRGANELHERAHPENGHGAEHEGHGEGDDGRYLAPHVGVVLRLGV